MAGTAFYQVEALHTYQRALEHGDLREALPGKHLYVISRRPRTTVEASGSGLGRPRLTTRTHDRVDGNEIVHATTAIADPVVNEERSYWSGTVEGQPVNGEAWHLASMLSDRAKAVSTQEVLYVGKAFGKLGSRHVGDRTSSHSTLQKIYEDHHALDWDIFLTPLSVGSLLTLTDDHIDDGVGGLDGGLFGDIMSGNRGAVAKNTVDVVEHLLISYFRPKYNVKLLEWVDAKHLIPLRTAGFRLVAVQLQALHELASFFSPSRKKPERSHRILAEVPALQDATSFTIGGWDDVELPELAAIDLLAGASRTTSELADSAPAMLRVFGSTEPTRDLDFSGWV